MILVTGGTGGATARVRQRGGRHRAVFVLGPARSRRQARIGGLAILALLLVARSGVVSAEDPAPNPSKTVEVPFETHDGYALFGKLTVPVAEGRHPVVIYVQTAEGSTVDTKRPDGRGGTFNYFDLYREKLPPMGVAFFSY